MILPWLPGDAELEMLEMIDEDLLGDAAKPKPGPTDPKE